MAASGVPVQQSVTVGRPVDEVLTAIVQVLGGTGAYTTVQVSPGTVRFNRSFRPTWALVLGWLSVLCMGVGVLLFLVKTTETCTVTVVEGPLGTVLTVSGKLLPGLFGQIEDRINDSHGGDLPGETGSVQPAEVGADSREADSVALLPRLDVLPPPPAGSSALTRAQPITAIPGVPSVAMSSAPTDAGPVVPTDAGPVVPIGPSESIDETVARPLLSLAAMGSALRLDDGSVVAVTDRVLIGRQPSVSAGGLAASLVPVSDSTRSVSKTHLAIYRRDGLLWAEDLHSTNGSAVLSPTGGERLLVPGVPVPLEVGTKVRFGDRHLDVVAGV